MRRSLRMLAFGAWSALLLAAALPAAAQLQTGDLYGTVKDTEGGALPGVTVTLKGVGAPQVQVSDEAGSFRFLNLYPGDYSLQAELEGFSPLDVPRIDIRLGGKAQLELTMNSAIRDVVTVTTENPLLDERRATRGTNIDAVELNKIPTARDPWSLLAQAPGVLVDRVNVGGNESGQQSNFIGAGSTSRDNTFAVDGVVLTDMNAVGGSATYFDFGAFEEVELTVSAADVTVATSGVTVNQITKRGTNTWRGAGRYLRTDGEYQADPSLENGNRIDVVEEYGADIGGPLIKDRLWIWASEGRSDIGNLVPSTDADGNPASQLDRTQLEDFNAKLNFQLGSADSGVLHYWTNDKLKDGRGAGPFRGPETTHDQTTPQDIYKIEASHIFGPSFYLTGLFARDDGKFTLSPKGGLDANRFRTEDGILHGTNYDFSQDAVIDQGRLDASTFFNTGGVSHELKFGAGFREQDNDSITIWPRANFVNAGELSGIDGDTEQVVFPRNKHVKIDSRYESAWIQDTFSFNRLTVNAGVRYDKQTLENGATSDVGNPLAQGLLPAINFPGNDAGFEWKSVVPRLSATYALGEARKTLLRGSFSQYAEQLGQLPLASRVNPIGYSYAYFYFTDANGNLVLDPGEVPSLVFSYTYNIDPDNPASLVTPSVNDPNLKPSMTDELTFGFERELRNDFVAGLTLTARQLRDVPEERLFVVDEATGLTRLATRNDYELQPIPVPDDPSDPENFVILPNGQRVPYPTIYDLRDGLSPTGGTLYTNGDRKLQYLGASLSFTKRMSNHWMARGNFTWADWSWKIGKDYRNYADPTNLITDNLGFGDRGGDIYVDQAASNKSDVFISSRWSFNVNGLYQVAPERSWGFDLGANITGRQGFPTPPYLRVAGAGGRRTVQLTENLDDFKNDDVYLLDLHLGKDFKVRDLNLALSLDGFNVLNQDYVLQRDRSAAVENPYQPIERLSPRVLRAGLIFRFR
jgi:hypothetical protein